MTWRAIEPHEAQHTALETGKWRARSALGPGLLLEERICAVRYGREEEHHRLSSNRPKDAAGGLGACSRGLATSCEYPEWL